VNIQALHGQFDTDMWDADPEKEPNPGDVAGPAEEAAPEPSVLDQVLSDPEIMRTLSQYRTIK
jgi:hypothetical protein